VLKELFHRFIITLERLSGKQGKLGLTDSELASKLYGEKSPKRISTKRPGPNMPKWQPCPQCRAGSPRGGKTQGGANYNCHTHGVFFVTASRRIRGYA